MCSSERNDSLLVLLQFLWTKCREKYFVGTVDKINFLVLLIKRKYTFNSAKISPFQILVCLTDL